VNGKRRPSSGSCLRLADAFNADPDLVLTIAGHRLATVPLRADDRRAQLIAMLNRVKLTPDRLAGLEAQLQVWLENDRAESTAATNGS
jgi:hypothetical protein